MAKQLCPLSIEEHIALAPNITYAQLDSLAARALHRLRSLGLKKGDCIALPSHPDENTIALLFAAWRLSVSVALFSIHLPQETLQKHLQELQPRLLIDDAAKFFGDSKDEDRELEMDAIALHLLTSGSSGSAKWAAFTLGQLFESANTVGSALNAKEQDRWLLSLPLHHVGGLGVLLRAFCSRGTVVIENKQLPYPERIHSGHADFASLVPTQLYRLIQSDCKPPATHLLIGGAAISQQLYQQAIEKKFQLLLTYGLTEMSSTVFLTSCPIWDRHIPYLGNPLPGRQVKIFQNEILVSGPSLFAGYGRPPHRPPGSWFSTGDLGLYHEKHGFAITGRKDFQFISGGENIQPEEIEIALLSDPLVEQAVVVPLFDEEFGARPMAFVKSTKPQDQIIYFLTSRLPKFKIPVVILPLPDNENLKPNRRHLIWLANKNYHIINTPKP